MANFSLGVMCKPLGEQIPAMNRMEATRLQAHAEAIFTLALAGYLTTKQKTRLLDMLAKNVHKACKEAEGNNG